MLARDERRLAAVVLVERSVAGDLNLDHCRRDLGRQTLQRRIQLLQDLGCVRGVVSGFA